MKILVVEDERHIMRLIQVNLQRAGYEVLMAFCGQDALRLADTKCPDLVIIDQTLPDIAGDALARRLKQKQPAPALLLMFPKGIQPGWVEGWIKPANCFITKPFNPQELVKFAGRVLEANRRIRDTLAGKKDEQESSDGLQ